jgi:hypothetical protein
MNQLQSIQDQKRPLDANKWELKGDVKDVAQSKLLSQFTDGLDIHYVIAVVRVSGRFNLIAPWTVRSVCPHCYGGGEILTQSERGSIFRSTCCPRCQGLGYLETINPITVPVSREMAESGRVVLTGAGRYDSGKARGGDLIFNM